MPTPPLTPLPPLGARTSTWLTHEGQPVLGERHLAILEGVSALGSLNAAAKHLRISYRDAWGQIRHAEAALGVGLIAARTGGRHGGGSCLTVEGEQLVARLRAFHQEQRQTTARCAARYFGGTPPPALRSNDDRLVLATTTSLVDTGLLALLLAPFSQRAGTEVDVFAVGSGAALRLARTGDADVVLTHASGAEERSLIAGETVNRREVLTNEFVLVGPPDDPAGVRAVRGVQAALRRIAAARLPFLSRADESGTNQRERSLLTAAGVRPGRWYQRGHCGMAELLRATDAIRDYTLTDCGTFAAVADELRLDVLCRGGTELMNPYSVSATNPHRHEGANYLAAMELVGWLTSPATQEMIAAYRVAGRAVAQPASNGRPVRRARRR